MLAGGDLGQSHSVGTQVNELVAAIVDRVTVQGHILETGTQSYRLRTSKNIRGKSN